MELQLLRACIARINFPSRRKASYYFNSLRRSDDKTFAMRDYAMRTRVSLEERKRELHRTEVALTLVKRISPSRPPPR